MRFRVIAYVAPEGKMPDLMEAAVEATTALRNTAPNAAAPSDDELCVRGFQEATTPAGALLALIVGDALADVAGYISEGLREEYNSRILGHESFGGGLSPVEYAILPAVLHRFDGEDRTMAEDLLARATE